MRIASGSTDRKIAFVAVDDTDLKTRETGFGSSGWTVYRSRDGGVATVYSTPSVAELDATNMPGVYVLTIDEDTTVGATHDVEEYVVHISHAGMAPVTRALELDRVKFTEGQVATLANGAVDADLERIQGVVQSATDLKDFADDGYDPSTNKVAGVVLVDTVTTLTGHTPQTGDAFARLGAPAGASVSADIAAVQADTNDLQTRLPAALVSGRIDASVGSMANNVLTAAAINADAITAAKVAADVTTELQAGLATSAALANVQSDTDDIQAKIGTPAGASLSADVAAVKAETATILSDTNDLQTRIPAALVSGRIDASVGAMAANTVTAAAIATDAIDSDAMAASAVTEIQSGLATSAALANVQSDTDDIQSKIGTPAGASVSADIAAVKAETATILSDTNDLQTRVPAALVGGRIDASVGAMAANTVTASALDATASAEIADAVWDEAIAGHLGAGSTGAALNAAGGSGDPWATPIPGAYGAGTAGNIVGNALDATISSRASAAQATSIQADTDDIQSKIGTPAGASVSADVAAVKADTAAIKAKTDNLPADPADASDIAAATAAIQADTDNIQTRLPAALVSGRMDSSVGAMAANTVTAAAVDASAVTELQAGLATQADVLTRASPAQVNAEVLDVLNVDTFAQPGQEAPAATTTLQKMLAYLYKAFRNRLTQTATEQKLYADNGTTVDQKAVTSDDTVTYDRGEFVSGP